MEKIKCRLTIRSILEYILHIENDLVIGGVSDWIQKEEYISLVL